MNIQKKFTTIFEFFTLKKEKTLQHALQLIRKTAIKSGILGRKSPKSKSWRD